MNYRFEVPFCYDCDTWHVEGMHTRTSSTGTSSSSSSGTFTYVSYHHEPTKVIDPALLAALKMLNLKENATIKEARSAFREALSKHHPDHGGDERTTRLIIAARDELKKRGRM